MAEMTLAQAAEALKMTKQGLDYHRRKGHITARKVGRFYMVDPEIARKELQRHIYRSHDDASKADEKATDEPDKQSSEVHDVASPAE